MAHVNDASDFDIELLASTGTSVAYCPRASAYFRAADRFGPHRYQEMLRAGVNVAIGTDSIINLGDQPRTGTGARLSVFDEIRVLHRNGDFDEAQLLRMATVNGARALGLDARGWSLGIGAQPFGLVGVKALPGPRSPLSRAFRSDANPELLFIRS